jgi:hypothetical protein
MPLRAIHGARDVSSAHEATRLDISHARIMAGGRQTADAVKAQASEALTDARPRARGSAASLPPGPQAVLALQRAGGNAAVNALMAGRMRFPGDQAVADIDGALRELRRDEPAIDTVEKGLKAAKATGVPVDLEGIRPPASALAVTTTGFGPGAVPAKKPVPPPKKVPAVSPLGKAGAKKAKAGGGGKGGAKPAVAGGAGGGVAQQPAALSADALLQPPVRPSGVRPEADPAFLAVTGKVKATGREKRSHPSAASKAKEAQDAALPPAGDIGSQAKAAKADTMEAQRPGTFDKKAFIAAVKAAIEAKSPKTLKEADNYKSSGKAAEVKGDVKGLVTQGKEGQTADIKAATEAAPDQSKAIPKPVTPMGPEPPGQAVPVPATGAVPKPAPAEQLNLAAGKHEADAEMAEGEVTETQLAESNEPEFEQGLADKKAAAAHADTAPGEFRQQEAQVIAQGKADAAAETTAGMAGMQSSRGAALAKLVADKGKTKTKDEAKRAEVTTKIEGIFNATEADVKKILDGVDPKVEKEFNEGEAAARSKFENYVAAKMSAYKKDRYGGWLGPFRWARDKIRGMPDKVNEFYVAGRELYLKQMDKTIARVADIVGTDLTAAKQRIATGRNQIAAYVESLPKDLKKVGSEASKEIGERFEQLESDVDAKQESLVDTLATKYVEARKGLDERIEELQAENRGLIDKAIGAIKAIINTIRELAAMLKNVLARVAGVVGQIIKSPVRFLGNLIAGVKGGILKFKEDFLGHLRRGLMSWLFGALAEGGVELPKSFDLKGIIGFLASIFGLTWTNIRNRILKKIGEKAMGAVEKGVEIFRIISGPEGVGGLWQMLLTKLGDIKEMIFEKVKGFVQDRIITAGITWLIGLLNPAAAFIKACKLIYDVVMFFVNNASRIKKFVDTILDSVADIVRGNIGGVVSKINDVLGQMVPLIIGFLASVIGLGGIGAKVREIVQSLQKPVNKALDFVINTGLKLAAPIIRGLAGVSSKVKAKVAAGKAWVKGKVEAGKAKLRDLAALIPGVSKFRGGGAAHQVWVEKVGTHRVMVASVPTEASVLLDHYAAEIGQFPADTPTERAECARLTHRVDVARQQYQGVQGDVRLLNNVTDLVAGRNALTSRQRRFAESLVQLFDGVHKHRMKLAGKVPKAMRPGGKTTAGDVRCVATFMVAGPQAFTPGPAGGPAGTSGQPRRTTERTPRNAYEMESEESRLSGQTGGFVLEGRAGTQPAEQRAEFVTRSTGDVAPSAHAEARLLSQIERMLAADPTWRERIRTIEINISESPCPSCTALLLQLHSQLTNANIRLATLHWGKLHKGTNPTMPGDIAQLARRYTVTGPRS